MAQTDSPRDDQHSFEIKPSRDCVSLNQPLGIYLQLAIMPPQGSRSPKVIVPVRFDTATDFTTLPERRLEEAGVLAEGPIMKNDDPHVVHVNSGRWGERDMKLYSCTFELLFDYKRVADISTVVASDPQPPSPATIEQYERRIHKKLGGPIRRPKPPFEGVLSLADLMKEFDVQLHHTTTGPKITLRPLNA